jgi:hypothetical protein
MASARRSYLRRRLTETSAITPPVAYLMIERLYITPFGNRLPNLTFEVET